MINYLRSFLPNLSETVSPFRDLLKKNNLWNWNKQCRATCIKLKELLCNIPTLKYYESQHKLEIQCDASEKSIG